MMAKSVPEILVELGAALAATRRRGAYAGLRPAEVMAFGGVHTAVFEPATDARPAKVLEEWRAEIGGLGLHTTRWRNATPYEIAASQDVPPTAKVEG